MRIKWIRYDIAFEKSLFWKNPYCLINCECGVDFLYIKCTVGKKLWNKLMHYLP